MITNHLHRNRDKFQPEIPVHVTYGVNSLCDWCQVHLLPDQGVGVAVVDVVGVDLGAAAVFGTLPAHGHGGAVTAQQADSIGSSGSG